MQIGMIGLGRMGRNMVRRLMRRGHQCVVVRDLQHQHILATHSPPVIAAAEAISIAVTRSNGAETSHD